MDKHTTRPVYVVGAGISGIACARAIQDLGRDVGIVPIVLDRGNSPGGRMVSPTLSGRPVDMGASMFVATDPEFEPVVEDWRRRGLVRRSTGSIWMYNGTYPPSPAHLCPSWPRYAAPQGMASLVADLATDLDVRTGVTVTHVGEGPTVDGAPASAVALAMPAPEAHALVDKFTLEHTITEFSRNSPDIAIAVGFETEASHLLDPLRSEGLVRQHPVLSVVTHDGDCRGDDAPVLTAQASIEFARDFSPEFTGAPSSVSQPTNLAEAASRMVTALRDLFGLPAPAWIHSRYWKHGHPCDSHSERAPTAHLGSSRIGLCGDSWGGPPLESAYVSGTMLGRAIVAELTP